MDCLLIRKSQYLIAYFPWQDRLPTILRNLTDILFLNAKNMNAKDEKFIFHGVYNLLYGTVELLKVSADDAAGHGNTGLLSSDQVKVHFVTTVFVDMRLWKTKHPRKHF